MKYEGIRNHICMHRLRSVTRKVGPVTAGVREPLTKMVFMLELEATERIPSRLVSPLQVACKVTRT